MPPSWGEKTPKLIQKNYSLEIHRIREIFKNLSLGDASKLARNITNTASKVPQFGNQENKQCVKKSIPGRSLQAGEKYFQKTRIKHSLEIQRTSKMFQNLTQVDASKLGSNIFKTSQKETQFRDPENQPYIQQLYPREIPRSWGKIPPKLLQEKHSLKIQRTSHIFNICIPGRCLQGSEKYLQNCSKRTTIWRSRDTAIYSTIISQVDASNLGRNISKTAPNKTQFGAQENKQNVKKFIPGRCLHAGEKYSPKQLQKNHRLEILRTSLYSTIVSLGDASKLGRNISKTAKKTNNSEIQRSSHLYTKEMPASWREISPKLF